MRINGLSGVQAVTIRGENGFLGVIHLCPQLRINHGHLTILSYIDLAKKGLICIESTTIFHLLDRPSGKSIVVFTARGDSKILSSTGNPAFFNLLRESPESVYMARSAHDFEKMRQCSMLLKRCYYPGQEASRHLIRSISGLPFDASAVQPAFEYDPDRTTFTQQSRRLANHENNSTPSIEMSDGSVDLAIDIMYCSWGDRDVLVMVTTPYNYLFTAPIKNLTAVVIHASLTLVVDALASASKKIRLAITDSAPNLKAACSLLRSSHQVLSEHRTASSHNPKADISIRYLKEKLRMAQLLLPIEITTPVYDAILSGITMTTNLIPCQQNGWISSHSALFGRNETIPLKGCWAATIGDSVYVAPTTDKHSNSTTDSRSMEGIYLGFSKIHQHVVVTANGLISRNNVTTSQTPFHTLIKNLNDNALGRRSTSPQTDTLISSNTNESHSIMAPPPASDISVRDSVEPSEGDIRTDYLDEKVQSELSSLHSSAAPADQVLIAANIQDLADEDFNWRAWSASVGLCAIDDPDGIAFAAVDTSNITSLSAALRIHAGDPTMLGVISSSCESELRGLMDAGTFTPIHMSKLSRLQVTHMLRSSVKFKMKNVNSTSPTGKARFVADPGGQPQDLYSREETSSSAVGASTVLSLFVLAASSDFFVRTFDIKQAYLHGVLGDPVPMSIKSNVADIICKIDGKYNAYRRPDKSLIVMVRRGLYGQRASGKIWWDLLAQAILSFGFSQNAKDEYLFYKLDPKGDIASCVAIYVDDLFVMSRLESSLDQLEQQLIGRFKEITSSGRSDKLKYLGMDVTFDRTNKTCSVIMSDLVTKILAFRPPLDSGRAPTSPAQDDLYSIDELGAKLSSTGSENFHSSVAQLLYLAKRTRYDLLCAVQFLTSRVNAPSVQDAAKLDRIISYLAGTKSMELTLGGDKQNRVKLNGYFDASFKSRAGGLSQSGSIITYGRGSVYASSKKQSIVCLSAAEAELYALSEGAHELLHLQQVLEGLNLNSIARPADVQQDNESVIASIRNGRACSTKSKHIEQRHYWVSSYCTNQKFDIHHCRTELMVADILTKPLQGAQFRFLRGLLLGHAAINE